MDTIFALSTAPGRAGIAVVRISGPGILSAIQAFDIGEITPRRAVLRTLQIGGDVIDQAVVLGFGAGASFTGEEVLELHLHGSPAIFRRVLEVLAWLDGFRMAEPGEFTRRALENGRMDLAEVEGLGALLEAETEVQRRQAQRVFGGALGRLAAAWRADLIRAAALLEVTIDFADEEVPEDVGPEVTALIDRTLSDLSVEIAGTRAAERIREGFEIAIVGAPNAGKSTLLNALAGREAALTSSVAGTTRDVIEVRMDLRGLPVTFLDTAGLRFSGDAVEELGVARAADRGNAADLRVFLLSEQKIPNVVDAQPDDIKIWGKADIRGGDGVSGITGEGIDDLIGRIVDILQARASTVATATHVRHRAAMVRAKSSLEAALVEVGKGPARTELAAEEIRSALRAMEELVGHVGVEVLLDEIFSNFCLGK